jgi:magnesium/cobalt transport protein CorA
MLRPPSDDAADVRARLYDARGRDRDIDLAEEPELAPHRLLWVDVRGLDRATIEPVCRRFGVDDETLEHLLEPAGRPWIEDRPGYLFVRVLSVNDAAEDVRTEKIDCVVGENWIVTVHQAALLTFELFDESVRADSVFGRLSSNAFLANLLDWQLTTYLRALERFEEDVDELDERLLANDDPGDDLLERVVGLRRWITRLRRALAPHREVFAVMAQPAQIGEEGGDTAEHFRLLLERLQHAIDSAENARDMLLGSFDVFMTQTDQRTNQVMKLLTVVTATALPATVIAGIMGMSVRSSIYASSVAFWVALGLIAASMIVVLVLARRRRWI